MGKKYKNLFDKIVEHQNFWESFNKTSKGKRNKLEYLVFNEERFSNMKHLRESLIFGNYNPLAPYYFTIYEPKPRNITALKFQDRIVQHSIYAIIYPIFDKTFLPNSYACRKGYGTHKCAKDVQLACKKHRSGWYLKTDFSKYFHSISREVLWSQIKKKISCVKTLNLVEKFIHKEGIGINIGELLSQLFANIMGNIVDMWLKHTEKIKIFFRYMDDIVIFGENKESLILLKDKLQLFCGTIGLRFSKWFIKPIRDGINFVGYIIFADFKLIRKSSIRGAKRKLRILTGEKREKFLASWLGHIQHANCYNLKFKLGVA